MMGHSGTSPRPAPAPPPPRRAYRASLFFEYTGKSALTAVSPQTGRRYRFLVPGARLEIDPRDRPWLASLPQLREVATP
jgi:hypothetical protein